MRQVLRGLREAVKERLVDGGEVRSTPFETAVQNARMIGACEMVKFVLDLDVERLNSELTDAD
jgi:hypothetical protein